MTPLERDLQTELWTAFPLALVIAADAAYLLAAVALRQVERMCARPADHRGHPRASGYPSHPGPMRSPTSDASHELRTPLALLKTELELALHRPRTATETDTALRSALQDTDRLVALAEDLLLLARTDRASGRTAEPVDLGELLAGVAHRYQIATPARPIRVHCPPHTGATVDLRQLERAVANLLDNAMRHGAGPIDISTHITGDHLEIRVRDHGPGFPPDFLPRAFDRFSRPDTARTGGGTGLGLAIVAAITRRHGGTAHATNHPDRGAQVFLHLPISIPARDHPDPQPTAYSEVHQRPQTRHRTRHHRGEADDRG